MAKVCHITSAHRADDTRIFRPAPQHALPVFKDASRYGETFPNAVRYCASTFFLPMHPYLTEIEQNRVITAVLEALT